ncbi:MAG TPA: response regulator [Gaiellaceae bacterium]|nr:response regulator [Gaiellaceae bacterium]
MSIRCLIVDDNESFLGVARELLEQEGLNVAGVASTTSDALRQVELLRPNVVLVDIFLGDESGIDLARRLTENGLTGGATVILISTHAETDVADLIASSPAAGFVPKADLSASAIRRIVNGRVG